MEQHPAVRPLGWGAKELHALDDLWEQNPGRTADEYFLHFRRRSSETSGEWTPRYMWDPWAVPTLLEYAPEVKLLVMLRDPLARLRSGVRHAAKSGPVTADAVSVAFDRGLYGRQMEHVLANAEREQVLVLQLEQCLRQPQQFLDRTFGFLGISAYTVAAPGERNEARVPPIELSDALIRSARATYRDDIARLQELCPGAIDADLWTLQ